MLFTFRGLFFEFIYINFTLVHDNITLLIDRKRMDENLMEDECLAQSII
jgi:hypothetical protein